MVTEHDVRTPEQEWADRVMSARTPQEFAWVIAARKAADQQHGASGTDAWLALALAQHANLRLHDCYSHLNTQPRATPMQAVELERLTDAGPYGTEVRLLHPSARQVFDAREWAKVYDSTGNPASVRDWTARMYITIAGQAHAAATFAEPVTLTDAQAYPLLVIERAGEWQARWPGDESSYRLAARFGLVHLRRRTRHEVPDWFALSDTGKRALARWRTQPVDTIAPTLPQLKLLDELRRSGRPVISLPKAHRDGTYACSERRGWIQWHDRDEFGRWPVSITAEGERVLTEAAGKPKPRSRQVPTKAAVGQLQRGQVVRLARRSGFRHLSPAWVTVDRVEHVPRTQGAPGGYRVWIATEDGRVRGYADETVFHPNARFQIKP